MKKEEVLKMSKTEIQKKYEERISNDNCNICNNYCDGCDDCYYCDGCDDCYCCYYCNNISHKQYCILNVQFTKEEYEEKIKEFNN